MNPAPSPGEHAVGTARMRLVKADITALACDAIVNAANDRLWMGGGVAGAIKRLGGEAIEREAVGRPRVRSAR